jgi:tetratricopeptide (TPR) repeat protein
VELGEARTEPERRYEAICAAAVCARLHKGGESKALALCERIGVEPYAKACRAKVYTWAVSPSNVVAELGGEDFSTWPEDLAAIGYANRGAAYYTVKKGPEAARDFLKAFQCGTGSPKWSAFQRLGDTYWKLLGDEVYAEAIYRKCVHDIPGGYPGLQARVNLAELLLSQKRYEDALECLFSYKHGGSWQVRMLYARAKVYGEMGKKAEARACLEEALNTVGIQPRQAKQCKERLATLE